MQSALDNPLRKANPMNGASMYFSAFISAPCSVEMIQDTPRFGAWRSGGFPCLPAGRGASTKGRPTSTELE
ncbi:MAG: hypothetical protein IM577_01815 [Chitinophagaceae bacterium]|nr:hypothetical protein [Chitinophagaceae bacterium]